jgi:hypothetical protein
VSAVVPETSERARLTAIVEARLRGEPSGPMPAGSARLDALTALFGLSEFERDVVGVLWVLALAPALRGELKESGSGHVTPLEVARLFGHAPRARLASESGARSWRIVRELELLDAVSLALDPVALAWLEDDAELDRALVGSVRMLAGLPPPASWPVDATAREVRAGMDRGERIRLVIAVQDRCAAESFAVAVAGRLGVPVMRVEPVAHADESAERAVRVHRQAFLDRVAPCFDSSDPAQALPGDVVAFPLQFVVGRESPRALGGVRDVRVVLPSLSPAERAQLWLQVLPEAQAWPRRTLDELSTFEVELGEVVEAARAGPCDARQAVERVRAQSRDHMAGLVQRLESAFTWDDLVLPEGVHGRLREIAFEARERAHVWAEPEARRLYAHGRGLVALFAGPPGTGKTMAGQVIASELGLDLLRVDLSAVVSKWVGETAQNLQKILSARTSRRAVLFFDEADALYGKRVEDVRDAQDRHANMDISHLMVALESYDGIVLLATNLRANIDPAFVRRIRHLVEFPRPDDEARRQIWLRVVTALFGAAEVQRLGDELRRVAAIEATGAQIKNAALSALFSARRSQEPASARLFGDMLARELTKDGGGLSSRELDALLEAPVLRAVKP